MKVKYKQLYSNDCGISSIKNLLFINLSERHIRGGMATRHKFKGK